jgi:hypothetical protein
LLSSSKQSMYSPFINANFTKNTLFNRDCAHLYGSLHLVYILHNNDNGIKLEVIAVPNLLM